MTTCDRKGSVYTDYIRAKFKDTNRADWTGKGEQKTLDRQQKFRDLMTAAADTYRSSVYYTTKVQEKPLSQQTRAKSVEAIMFALNDPRWVAAKVKQET